MRLIRAAFSLCLLSPAALHAQRETPLRVTRTTPTGDAAPFAPVTVTFDRPVAGSLDRTVDAASILRISPAVQGKLEWRDPVTIQLRPTSPLSAGTRYTVTVDNAFRAMDGSALATPYEFSFRARGPTLLAGNPVGSRAVETSSHLASNTKFDVVYSTPVDLARLTSDAFLEFSTTCGERIVRLTATSERHMRKEDPFSITNAGGWDRDRKVDSLRRVVQLTPLSALPRGCAGELVLPAEVSATASNTEPVRWKFATYGDFRLVELACADRSTPQQECPRGPLIATFSNPVRGSAVQTQTKLLPATKFIVRDTSTESTTWTLEATLKPRTAYALVADTSIRDVFRQPLIGNPAIAFSTTGFDPFVGYPIGRILVERTGPHTLVVQHANVDTLVATITPVPDSLVAGVLAHTTGDSIWDKLTSTAIVKRVAVKNVKDRPMITGVGMPTFNAMRKGNPALFAVKIVGRAGGRTVADNGGITIVQVSDLGVHAKLSAADASVFVTGVNDGKPKAGAAVSVFGAGGQRIAAGTTDADGLARFRQLARTSVRPVVNKSEDDEEEGSERSEFEGYVSVTLGTDRGIASVSKWDPDLSPDRFNIYDAWGDEAAPLAGAVFTERGIYRPGETVFAKAIIRRGLLGNLKTPAMGDSVRWRWHDRDDGMLREITAPLTAFGTSTQTLPVKASAAVGEYAIDAQAKFNGQWHNVATASYRVAEYRPPEFLVDLTTPPGTRYPGDRITATAQARYLFGAPMGGATIAWAAEQKSLSSWEFEVPGMEDWYIGSSGTWWEDAKRENAEVISDRIDTLDARGLRTFTVSVPNAGKGRAIRVTVGAVVTDINRQTVSTSTSSIVHPAEFYIAARSKGDAWFWKGGTPQTLDVVSVTPEGKRTSGARVSGIIVRREWHRIRRMRDGVSELVGEWVQDTVGRCALVTSAQPAQCTFTPKEGGMHIVTLSAKDSKGHVATTSFIRWTSGDGWVPWSDETQFRMDVIPDRKRYSVGDTATVMFASPFINTDAWVTIEREGLIDQRRIHITSGSTTLRLPITESFAPNVYVSILVAKGRTAPPGTLDDAGRPAIRVGYAELRVTPEAKRLTITTRVAKTEYGPGDSASVRLQVKDVRGQGVRSEVTLWAVDEGVLSLTGYKTPDPLDLIYQERGLGLHLASNMTAVAPQIPEGEKGYREAGGGGGVAGADVLRSRFQTTAFFLGSVITDAFGAASATAKLPDNLTTFRLMAIAVTNNDRYGKGQSSILVTRPLLARQALPRFVRAGDRFVAGAVINRRDGASVDVTVKATTTGAELRGDSVQTVKLAQSKGAEVRFPFTVQRADSVVFRFDVSDTRNTDAVRAIIPVKPAYHPVAHVASGVLRDTATVNLILPANLDLARSRLSVNLGVSPLAMIRGIREAIRIYPYFCTEQVVSAVMPILAELRVQKATGETVRADSRSQLITAVNTIAGRQRADGGIGYWGSADWSTPWLTAYAGIALLDIRESGGGVNVDAQVLNRIAGYLTTKLHGDTTVEFTPVAQYTSRPELRLGERLAAVDFLSRFNKPDVAAENELVRAAAQLRFEDRARLAEILARRKQAVAARRIMESLWNTLKIEGTHVAIADSGQDFYFNSRLRPLARVLTSTLAVDPAHPLIGPLVETLAQQGRSPRDWRWNTQDYASVANALASYEMLKRQHAERTIQVRAGARDILSARPGVKQASIDSSVVLSSIVENASDRSVQLSLSASAGDAPVYYYFTLTEVPIAPPVTPEDRGIVVERWYESVNGGTPVQQVVEGDLVRVRLRITVPSTRDFVVLDDALPAGLEAIDLSLRTAAPSAGPGRIRENAEGETEDRFAWFGSWDSGWWSAFDHREIRDDRVVYAASLLWKGTYSASYIARATTAGTFVRPPAHAEEMYNPGVNGRSEGGVFVVTQKGKAP